MPGTWCCLTLWAALPTHPGLLLSFEPWLPGTHPGSTYSFGPDLRVCPLLSSLVPDLTPASPRLHTSSHTGPDGSSLSHTPSFVQSKLSWRLELWLWVPSADLPPFFLGNRVLTTNGYLVSVCESQCLYPWRWHSRWARDTKRANYKSLWDRYVDTGRGKVLFSPGSLSVKAGAGGGDCV